MQNVLSAVSMLHFEEVSGPFFAQILFSRADGVWRIMAGVVGKIMSSKKGV